MSYIHTLQQTMQSSSGESVTGLSTQTAGAEANLNEALPASQTDGEYDITFPYADLKSIAILSTVAATLKTNSSSEADDTLTLAAGVPVMWNNAGPHANLFTADVTKLYVTNTAVGNLTIKALYDPTPA